MELLLQATLVISIDIRSSLYWLWATPWQYWRKVNATWIVALCSWMQAFQKTAAGGLLVFRIIRPQFNVKRKMVIKDWHEVLILWIAQVRQRERAVAVDRAREWLKRGSSVRDTKHYFLIVTFIVSLHYKIQINTWASQHNAEDFVWMHASLCLLCASLPCLSVSV